MDKFGVLKDRELSTRTVAMRLGDYNVTPSTPRTDPYVRNYLIRLLPLVFDTKSLKMPLDVFCLVHSMPPLSLCTDRRCSIQNSHWSPSFPPKPPLPIGKTQHCSASSLVLRRCLTSQKRTRWEYDHRSYPTAPVVAQPIGGS